MTVRCEACGAELDDAADTTHAISHGDGRQWYCRACWMNGVALRLFASLMAKAYEPKVERVQ